MTVFVSDLLYRVSFSFLGLDRSRLVSRLSDTSSHNENEIDYSTAVTDPGISIFIYYL